jgi:hypothetical protein
MEAPKNKSSRLASTVRWVARILCILAMVSIGIGGAVLAGLLIIILIIAWKHELVGGILMALIGLATAAFDYINYQGLLHTSSKGYRSVKTAASLNFFLMISLPLIIVGVLFIISYFLHRPKKLPAQTP